VLGSSIPLDKEKAEVIAALTGRPYVMADYAHRPSTCC
jgi:hypothetical protein